MDLEILNKLFLELSQIATAETAKERLYKDTLRIIRHASDLEAARKTADEALRRAELR